MLRLFRSKIFIRQFLSYLLIILITFLAIANTLLKVSTESLEKQQLYMAENYRIQASESIRNWLKVKDNALKNQAMYISKFSEKDIESEMMLDIIKKEVNSAESLTDILIINSNGKIVNSVAGSANTNLSSREYFIEGMKGNNNITGFYRGASTGTPIMAISHPIIINGEVKYVLAGIIKLDTVRKMIEGLKFGEWGQAYLIDKDGTLITDSAFIKEFIKDEDIKNKDKYTISSKAVKDVLVKKSGVDKYTDFRGKEVFGSYEWIDDLKVGLIVEFNEEKTMEPTERLVKIMWSLSVLVILIGAILAYILSMRIVHPINKLVESTEDIISQNYKAPVSIINTDSELDILIERFNDMQAIIKDREEELNKKNDALKEQMAEVLESNRLKSEFLANMSHELRTPLNSIIGFTTRVIKKTEAIIPDVQLENLKIVKDEAYHLLQLINSILDFSKIEAGKMEIHKENFQLKEVIDEVGLMIKVLLEGKPINYIEKINTLDDDIC